MINLDPKTTTPDQAKRAFGALAALRKTSNDKTVAALRSAALNAVATVATVDGPFKFADALMATAQITFALIDAGLNAAKIKPDEEEIADYLAALNVFVADKLHHEHGIEPCLIQQLRRVIDGDGQPTNVIDEIADLLPDGLLSYCEMPLSSDERLRPAVARVNKALFHGGDDLEGHEVAMVLAQVLGSMFSAPNLPDLDKRQRRVAMLAVLWAASHCLDLTDEGKGETLNVEASDA